MENYFNQFQPKKLSESRKSIILAPALRAIAEEEDQKTATKNLWYSFGKMLLAASFLFVFGFNYWIARWNQQILQQYPIFTAVETSSKTMTSEKQIVSYYDKFQEMYKNNQKLKQLQHYYLHIPSIK